jgi:hypothetical protein
MLMFVNSWILEVHNFDICIELADSISVIISNNNMGHFEDKIVTI